MNNYYPATTNLRFVKTTREEEQELFRKMREGDAEARETIIKHHLLFVAIVARKCAGGRFPDDEVVSAANEALVQAVDRKQFDATRGNRFTSYLRPFIRGAISKMWRESARYVPLPEGADTPVPSALPQVETSVEHTAEGEDFADYLHELLESGKSNLTEREQLVLSLMYEKGCNMAEVGRQLKMTRERVRQIHEEILTKLRKVLHKKGVDRR
jgi:RNA polymerase sigma factor (sigma-70 family)